MNGKKYNLDFPRLFTDQRNKLYVFDREEDGWLHFTVHLFWNKTKIEDFFKIKPDSLLKQFNSENTIINGDLEPFTGQDAIAYSYLTDEKYLLYKEYYLLLNQKKNNSTALKSLKQKIELIETE